MECINEKENGSRVDSVVLIGNWSWISSNIILNLLYFFIMQRVKAHMIPCPHQLPARGDNTVSVAQGGTATPGTTKQLLPPDKVFKRIIYARSIKSRDYIGRSPSFLVYSLWFLKNAFTFGRCYYAFTVTVSWCYSITWEWWFRVHFIHAENFSLSTKCILRCGLKTIWDNFQTATSESYFWKKRNRWVS